MPTGNLSGLFGQNGGFGGNLVNMALSTLRFNIAGVVAALGAMRYSIMQTIESQKGFNGTISEGLAQLNAARIRRQITFGRRTEMSSAAFLNMTNKLEQAWAPLKTEVFKSVTSLATIIMHGVTMMIPGFLATANAWTPQWLRDGLKSMNDLADELGKANRQSNKVDGRNAPVVLADLYRFMRSHNTPGAPGPISKPAHVPNLPRKFRNPAGGGP